jgi:hypothetical protein
MKRCPTCNRTFTDPNLSFCIDDGTPLSSVNGSSEEVTVVSPSANRTQSDEPPPTQSYSPRDWQTPAYQSPSGYVPPGGTGQKRRVWPWVVGIVGALFIGIIGLGIVGAILVPKMLSSSNRNQSVYNSNSNTITNENLSSELNANNSNSNNGNTNSSNVNAANENTNSADEGLTSAPTDQAEVLAALTDLEHEWTVANINADKKALDRILADDFVGVGPDGKSTGKAEYIRTIQRDTVTQKWDFENLKLALNGNRATLTGIVKYQLRDNELSFRFTDKFVWRDDRWQATGSVVKQI